MKTLKLSARWLRSRFGTRALILGYHRIADVNHDPYGLCVSPASFSEQLEVLHRHFHPLSMWELVEGVSNDKLPQRGVALTFDDGYADFFYNALPLLEKYEVPASVFIVSGRLGRRFWWDQPKTTYFSVIEIENQDVRVLCIDEILALASNDLIEIGAHSVNHLSLANIPVNEQIFEIKQSRIFLSELLGHPVTGFSYPHGSNTSLTSEIVKDCGYQYACASHNDVVQRSSDLFNLPRFWVNNWGAKKFKNWLDWWLLK